MEQDKTVRDAFLDTVLNQVNGSNPPEARATYDRLIAAGRTRSQALILIATALRAEMNRMLSEATPFDNKRYAALLKQIEA